MAEAPRLNELTKRISGQLKERGFCLVFAAELERCWPSEEIEAVEREREIEAFAKSNGWSVSILDVDSGTRAIFRIREP